LSGVGRTVIRHLDFRRTSPRIACPRRVTEGDLDWGLGLRLASLILRETNVGYWPVNQHSSPAKSLPIGAEAGLPTGAEAGLPSRAGSVSPRAGSVPPRGRDGWTRGQARYLTSPPATVMTTRVSRIASAWAKRASSEA